MGKDIATDSDELVNGHIVLALVNLGRKPLQVFWVVLATLGDGDDVI
jgi:hypothetical protein